MGWKKRENLHFISNFQIAVNVRNPGFRYTSLHLAFIPCLSVYSVCNRTSDFPCEAEVHLSVM